MKKTIRLTESQLNKVIKNAIKFALTEQQAPIETLAIARVKEVPGGRALVYVADSSTLKRYAIFTVTQNRETGEFPIDQTQKVQNYGLSDEELSSAQQLVSTSSRNIQRNWNKSNPNFTVA